jgi:hypothetical protein
MVIVEARTTEGSHRVGGDGSARPCAGSGAAARDRRRRRDRLAEARERITIEAGVDATT